MMSVVKDSAGKIMWSTDEVAKVLGWPTHRARRWLKREGACRRYGSRWYANSDQIRRVFHEAADRIIVQLSLAE